MSRDPENVPGSVILGYVVGYIGIFIVILGILIQIPELWPPSALALIGIVIWAVGVGTMVLKHIQLRRLANGGDAA